VSAFSPVRGKLTTTDRQICVAVCAVPDRILFGSRGSFEGVVGRVEADPASAGLRLLVGPGVAWSEEPVFRM
jgi:hypothetical protein